MSARLTNNPTGRPKGSKDKKKRKIQDTAAAAKKRSEAAKKAAATRRQQRAEKAEALKAEHPAAERPDVQVTPYPRAGDSPEFEQYVEDQKAHFARAEAAERAEQIKTPQPIPPGELLQVKDVAEWVAWPFLLWSQTTNMKSLLLTDAEAIDLAEPLTSIMNRHGIGDLVPPDVLDGLKFGARATPVMTERFCQVKRERQKRAGHGGPVDQGGGGQGGPSPVQGAPHTAPKEV